MNDPGVGQHQADQADSQDVAEQLVDHPDFAVRELRQAAEIGLCKTMQVDAVESGNAFWKRKRWMAGSERPAGLHLLKSRHFAGAMNLRVAGENLLDKSAPGAGHSKHENRNCRGIALSLKALEQAAVEHRGNALKQIENRLFLVVHLAALQSIALSQMFKSEGIISHVVERFGQSKMGIDGLVRGQIGAAGQRF